jgi:hypothetical protein
VLPGNVAWEDEGDSSICAVDGFIADWWAHDTRLKSANTYSKNWMRW